ncbi:ATP-binding protein [Nonomuraea sp. WAC 01424]|uniref:ATP-binding protein n=1 Tax=Nonomuraea sp. WAC 01424 TaxID=2203200 RepID=UPI0028A186EB|nr:ATP-binding protein [Nonomuraea sp. WAC 01424]
MSRPGPYRTTPWTSPAGSEAPHDRHEVRFFTAAELVETLYRSLADNSVGRVIESLLRADLIIIDDVGCAALDGTGTQLLFRFVAAAYERRVLVTGSHWPSDRWGTSSPNTRRDEPAGGAGTTRCGRHDPMQPAMQDASDQSSWPEAIPRVEERSTSSG